MFLPSEGLSSRRDSAAVVLAGQFQLQHLRLDLELVASSVCGRLVGTSGIKLDPERGFAILRRRASDNNTESADCKEIAKIRTACGRVTGFFSNLRDTFTQTGSRGI